jgi:hypothetical protein
VHRWIASLKFCWDRNYANSLIYTEDNPVDTGYDILSSPTDIIRTTKQLLTLETLEENPSWNGKRNSCIVP